MWKWLNWWRVQTALEAIDPDLVDLIEEALEQIRLSPYDPAGVHTHELRAVTDMPDTRIAWLPGRFYLTYRPYLSGPPPYAGQHIVVISMLCFDDLESPQEDSS